MLGLRDVFGTRLDLWVGPEDLFFCDEFLLVDSLSKLEAASKSGLHLGVLVHDSKDFNQELLLGVQEALAKIQGRPRRITFIIPLELAYEPIENLFLGFFPESGVTHANP